TIIILYLHHFFIQAEDVIRDFHVTGVQTCALPICFRTSNSKTGNPVRSRYVDAETNRPVADGDEVRGYEVEEGRHIIIEDEELEIGRASCRERGYVMAVDVALKA